MKKVLLSLGILALMAPVVALAAQFRSSENGSVSLSADEQAKNLYSAGQIVTIDGKVSKDLFAAGSSVFINGNTEDSVFAAGTSVNIKGDLGGSARVAGEYVVIDGSVGGDIMAAGNNVVISSDAVVSDDVFVMASSVDLGGTVGGKAVITAKTVKISGKITGDVTIHEAESVTLTDSAVVSGKLTYAATQQASIDRNAIVVGGVDYQEIQTRTFPLVEKELFSLTKIIGTFVFLLLLIYLLPKFTRRFVEAATTDSWDNLGWGFLMLIVTPIVSLILLILVATAGIAIITTLAYFIFVAVSAAMAALLVGLNIVKYFKKEKEFTYDWVTALTGAIAVAVIAVIPVIGPLLLFVLFLVAFGTFAKLIRGKIKANQS